MPPKKKTKKETAAQEKPKKVTKVTSDENDEDDISDDLSEAASSDEKRSSKKRAPKKKTTTTGAGKMNQTTSDLKSIDFSCPSGDDWNLKISSWNVNGIRALLDKNGLEYLKYEDPDIFCLQETKCSKEKIPEKTEVEGYTTYWLSGDSEGYSGVGLYTKKKPLSVLYGIGDDEHDKDGRVITAEYDKFYLILVYVPNAGRKLVRLANRIEWDLAFRTYVKKLDDEKPVILCGDMNVAHEEIDIANPKGNKKNAGFTKEERDGFTSLLDVGFVDTFRYLHPKVDKAYTFWTFMMNSRAKNVGWRLDYFVLSKTLLPNLRESVIRKDVFGSDHCPITLFLSI